MKYLLVLIALLSAPTYAALFNANHTARYSHHNPIINVSQKKKQRVVMYSANGCHFCKQARNYFRAHRIPYVERNIDRSSAALRQFKAMNAYGTPFIVMGKRKLIGFSVPRFQQFYR